MTSVVTATADLRLDGAALQAYLDSPQGPPFLELGRRMDRVKGEAQGRVGVSKDTEAGQPHLRDAIVTRAGRDGKGAMWLVGAVHPVAWLHHQGTVAHVIVPRNATVLVFEIDGETVFSRRVNHPGTPPNKYLTDSVGAAR